MLTPSPQLHTSHVPDVVIPAPWQLSSFNHECYNCHTTGHFTALCRRPHTSRCPADIPNKRREFKSWQCRSSHQRHSSRSLSRERQSCRSNSINRRNTSSSCSQSQDHTMRRWPRHGRYSPTLYRHQVSHLVSSNTTSKTQEGQLYTNMAPDGHRPFHTTLQLVTKQGCKSLLIKVGPGADVNTIPPSHFKTLFPMHFNKDGNLEQKTPKKHCMYLVPTWWSYTILPQILYNRCPAQTTPAVIPISFDIFQDSTRPFMLLSYPASIHLGIPPGNLKYQMRQVHMQWSTPSQITKM